MAGNKRLLILPGDGIGPDCMAQVRRVIDWLAARRALAFEVEEGLVGGAAAPISRRSRATPWRRGWPCFNLPACGRRSPRRSWPL